MVCVCRYKYKQISYCIISQWCVCMQVQVEEGLTLHHHIMVCVYASTSRSRFHTASSYQWLVCMHVGSRSRSHTASSHQWLVCMQVQVEVGLTLHHHIMVCVCMHVEVGLTLHHHTNVRLVCMQVQVEVGLTLHHHTNGVCACLLFGSCVCIRWLC